MPWARSTFWSTTAGIAGAAKTAWECTTEEWHQVIEVDLYSVFHCCHAIVPIMHQQGWGQDRQHRLDRGKEGNPNASHYSAAKAGVIGFCKSLAKELSTKGILVNCVTPAVIKTDILKQLTQEHIDYMRSKIPDGPLRGDFGSGRPGRLAGFSRLLVQHRGSLRYIRGSCNLLI